MSAQPQKKQSRIPVALQAVFLASNRGKEVHKPPPEKAANKVFFRNWLFQKASTSFSRGKKSQIVRTADVKTPTETKKRPALRKTDSNDNVSIARCLAIKMASIFIPLTFLCCFIYVSC
jgi:hypothetical protein